MTTPIHSRDPSKWGSHASEYAQRLMRGPMLQPVLTLLELADKHSPFSGATSIVDIGTGPGTVIENLFRNYTFPDSATVLATDFSDGMLEVLATTRNSLVVNPVLSDDTRALWKKLNLQTANAERLTDVVPPGSVSHATASFVLFFCPNPRAALASIHDALTPSGVLAVSSWEQMTWVDLLEEAISTFKPGFPRCSLAPPEWRTCDAVKGEMLATGFSDVVTKAMDVPLVIADVSQWCKSLGLSNSPVFRDVLDRLSVEEQAQVPDALEKMMKERFGEGEVTLVGKVVLAVGRK